MRRIEELQWAHRDGPAPPSQRNHDVPGALDELVMSMLSVEPLARPSSAAEVMDGLRAVGGLEPAPELEVVQGYVQSAALVGRDREMAVIRERIRRTLEGGGRAVVVSGRSGAGKSGPANGMASATMACARARRVLAAALLWRLVPAGPSSP